jgi:type VII secretion-associated serine protease mycosin
VRTRLKGVIAVFVAVLAAAVGGPAAASGQRAGASAVKQAVPLPDMSEDGEWWFTAWQIPKVWAAGARGQGVTVAVVDTGVQASRPELRGVVLPGTDFHGGDGRTDHSRQVEGSTRGHGTAVALLIAGQGGPSGLVGVAPEARILPVVRQNGSDDVARTVRWAVDHGAKVVNLSYYVTGACSDDAQAAVRYAIQHGAVVVTAAGNYGGYHETPVGSPANCLGALDVAAIDNRLQAWNMSARGPYVGVAAPGVNMQSMDLLGRKSHSTGTSDASALTSAVIALVWSKYPQLTNRQVVARLLATTRDLGAPGRDDVFGYGAVRPYLGITTDVPTDAPNPIFDRLPAAAVTSSPAVPALTAPESQPPRYPKIAGVSLMALLIVGGAIMVVVVGVLVVVLVTQSHRRARRSVQQLVAEYPVQEEPLSSSPGQWPPGEG